MSARLNELFAILDDLSSQLDSKTVVELIDVYSANSYKQLAKIEAASLRGDVKELTAHAHSLKSSSANLGALELSQICLKIEKAGKIDAETKVLVEKALALRDESVQLMQTWKNRAKVA